MISLSPAPSTSARATVAPVASTDLTAASGLPRLDAALARALGRLYASEIAPLPALRGCNGPAHWEFAPAAPSQTRAPFRFRLGTTTGWLALDAPLRDALLDERRADQLPRDLQYLLLAEALHPLAAVLEASLHVRFEWAPPDPATEVPQPACADHALFFNVTESSGARHGGHVWFERADALAALLAAAPSWRPQAAPRPGLQRLRVPLAFVIGRTHLSVSELRSVRRGDIVRVEHWMAKGPAVSVVAEVGGPAGLRLRGLAEGARITLLHKPEAIVSPDPAETPPASGDSETTSLPLERLDAFEVTLRFELAELSLPLGELRGLRAGHVFQLGQPLNRSPVRIAAHGNLLGKGYLVAVGDQLGIRVSEFVPGNL